MDHLQNELKKEFQIERMILFSDAVFAIALTLLVIDLRVPALPKEVATDGKLLEALNELIPKFFGFFVSFLFIGSFWLIHHRLFGYVVNYDNRLLVLNLVFMLSIVLMPFSTAFFSEYFLRGLKTPFILYSLNILFLGVMNTILWLYVGSPKQKLNEGLKPPVVRYYIIRSVIMPVIFVAWTGANAALRPKYSLFIVLALAIVMRRVVATLKRQMKSRLAQTN
ncbi:MAG: TMEM175 family protein [Bacteroidota bacterium]|nr:TMEM175 family protein [Bacteroidota bacterium]MDP4217193.1 TMEM175 family protein [Bacteroidota bacterium]MDP4244803.1 TMEM175 family protein [Bacteroidota bacterium]MDP4252590.1 TMEM175 family protein [Bacteroidota bacterium]MDP4258438.1 TMEM175 family protein [Bacteroidota bacterium]